MKLENPVMTKVPETPKELEGKFEIAANYPLNEREAILFNVLLKCIVNEMKKDNINFKDLYRVTAIITKDGKYTACLDNNETMGSRISIVVYAVERWRNKGYGDNQIITILAEELCHHYWNIEDEVKVKYKVYEIIKGLFPGATFNQFYNI